MGKISQKDGVYAAVAAYLADSGRSIDNKIDLSDDDKATIIAMLTVSLQAGKIFMGDKARLKYTTLDSMSEYAKSLLSNWMRKDIRLNGGTIHRIKRPGARSIDKDKVVKQLKQLKRKLVDDREISLVDIEISRRIAKLTGEKDAS